MRHERYTLYGVGRCLGLSPLLKKYLTELKIFEKKPIRLLAVVVKRDSNREGYTMNTLDKYIDGLTNGARFTILMPMQEEYTRLVIHDGQLSTLVTIGHSRYFSYVVRDIARLAPIQDDNTAIRLIYIIGEDRELYFIRHEV